MAKTKRFRSLSLLAKDLREANHRKEVSLRFTDKGLVIALQLAGRPDSRESVEADVNDSDIYSFTYLGTFKSAELSFIDPHYSCEVEDSKLLSKLRGKIHEPETSKKPESPFEARLFTKDYNDIENALRYVLYIFGSKAVQGD